MSADDVRFQIRKALGLSDAPDADPHGFKSGPVGALFALSRPRYPQSQGPARSASLRHVYGGTVPPGVVAERRRKNRAARKARRINRRSA